MKYGELLSKMSAISADLFLQAERLDELSHTYEATALHNQATELSEMYDELDAHGVTDNE